MQELNDEQTKVIEEVEPKKITTETEEKEEEGIGIPGKPPTQ